MTRERPGRWIPVGRRLLVLPLGGSAQCHVVRQGQRWLVHACDPAGDHWIATAQTLDEATMIGEACAEALGTLHLSDPEAAWRAEPASVSQREALRRWRSPVPHDCTKGRAQDALIAAIARRLQPVRTV